MNIHIKLYFYVSNSMLTLIWHWKLYVRGGKNHKQFFSFGKSSIESNKNLSLWLSERNKEWQHKVTWKLRYLTFIDQTFICNGDVAASHFKEKELKVPYRMKEISSTNIKKRELLKRILHWKCEMCQKETPYVALF